MASIFEETHFLSRKWLLSMFEGEARLLPHSKCKYGSIKVAVSQLKKEGKGVWRTKKGESFTKVTRIK